MSAQFAGGVDLRDLDDSEVVSAMKEQVEYLSSAMLEGRKAGSEGEREAAAYVSDMLSSYGLDVLSGEDGDVFGLRQENGDTLRSRNVLAYIPGYDPNLRDHYIVIGARLDNLGTSEITVDGVKRRTIYYAACKETQDQQCPASPLCDRRRFRLFPRHGCRVMVFSEQVICRG